MDLEGIILSETCQAEKGSLYHLTYVCNPREQQASDYNRKATDLQLQETPVRFLGREDPPEKG